MKLQTILHLSLLVAASNSIQATTLFSDTFDSYADGTADVSYTAAYNNNGGGDAVSTGTGLGGSKSIQNNVDTTLTRKDLPIDLNAGDSITLDIFFQQNGAPSGAARPQIGILGLNDNGGVFNGGTGGDLSARIGGGNNLELRANNGSVASGAVESLTSGNWYDLRFTATKSSTPNIFDLSCWIYNSDNSGNTGTLVDSLSFAGFSNSTIYNDTSVFAGLRESSTILNMDNFSAGLTPAPEPSTVALLSLSGAAVLFFRRRMTQM